MREFVLTIRYSADDNSALDDLNRVSEAIGGSDNVLDLSSGAGDASLQSPAGSAMGNDGTAEGAAPEGVFGQDSPLGFGLGGRFSPPLTFSIPLVLTRYAATGGRPARKPTPTSTGPKIVKLSTVDAQTAVVHSDSRQSEHFQVRLLTTKKLTRRRQATPLRLAPIRSSQRRVFSSLRRRRSVQLQEV